MLRRRRWWNRSGIFALVPILLLLAVVAPGPVLADSLDAAKAAGLVGEQRDGYLGVADASAGDQTRRLVEDINAKRRAEYQSIATRNGTSVQAVAALAGAKLIERAPAGQKVQGARGQWVVK